MKKLKLDIEALQVETFAPEADDATLRGTVDARQIQPYSPFCPISVGGTCQVSCAGSCLVSCNASCICPVTRYVTQCICPVETTFCPVETPRCPIDVTTPVTIGPEPF